MTFDYRSDAAKEYRKLYNNARWRKKRAGFIALNPLCAFCEAVGITRASKVADHVKPHRGDEDEFWNGELQALCANCHNAAKQREETGGYDSACDADGYPISPMHPVNVDARRRR